MALYIYICVCVCASSLHPASFPSSYLVSPPRQYPLPTPQPLSKASLTQSWRTHPAQSLFTSIPLHSPIDNSLSLFLKRLPSLLLMWRLHILNDRGPAAEKLKAGLGASIGRRRASDWHVFFYLGNTIGLLIPGRGRTVVPRWRALHLFSQPQGSRWGGDVGDASVMPYSQLRLQSVPCARPNHDYF